MIELKGQSPFGRGSHRAVYQHPGKKERCLKVMTEDWRKCKRRERAGWLSRTCRSKRYFHENLNELHFSESQRKRLGEIGADYFAQSYGFVETDLGEALEVDLITDHDGKISVSLKEYLLKSGMTTECEEAIEFFWDGVMKHGIFLQGRPDNVSTKRLSDGSCRILAIDGFGLPQLLPMAKWFGYARQRFLRKRRAKQDAVIKKILKARETGEDLGDKGMVH